MATPFSEWPWPVQFLFFLGLGIAVVLAGLYVPMSPVRTVRQQLEDAQQRLKPLETEVAQLRVYQQRRVELQGEMDALEKQLATLQTIVPEEKQVDQFIQMVQGAASSSGVQIRRLLTKPIAAKDYHYEMPFDIEADGPYYAVLDFFTRLSRLSRIINVGDLQLKSIGTSGTQFRLTPGTSVTGTMTVTTFFTKTAEQEATAASAPQPGKR
jgi:Tfp pilus assembly protein PilO